MNYFLLFFISIILLSSCSVDPEIKPIVDTNNIKEIIPAGWPTPHYNFSNNKLTADGFLLGKELFYDPILSSDNSISCGSCHQQFAAFSNFGELLVLFMKIIKYNTFTILTILQTIMFRCIMA